VWTTLVSASFYGMPRHGVRDGPDVAARFKEMRGKGMPEGVPADEVGTVNGQ
jgi:hypothetical protein